jgi:hypothetical protein
MKHEYHEGPKAGENFERLARAVFQAPKVANPKKQARKPIRRKKSGQRQGLELVEKRQMATSTKNEIAPECP